MRTIESDRRDAENERERERARGGRESAALLPGWEVFSIERTRSVLHSSARL